MIHYLVPAAQEVGFREYLECWGLPLAGRARVRHYEELLAGGGGRPLRLEPGTWILAALDQLQPGMARLVAEVHARLDGREDFRFLNHPTRTLRRYDLMTELHRRGLSTFRAIRAAGDLSELRYPVFLRAEGSHDGALTPLLGSPAEVEAALGRVMMARGRRPRDLLVVEFCSTRDLDGGYRKYAAFAVGNRIVPRSMDYGFDWMLKHRRRHWSRSVVEEEREYVFDNPHASRLAEIFRIAGVGYGRIDYALEQGRVQTWEINLHPTIGRGLRPSRLQVPAELEPIRRQTKERFYATFQAALEAADVGVEGRPAVDVEVSPELVRAARSVETRRGRTSRTLVRLLHPMRPLFEPMAAPLYPLLGRMVRRGAGDPPA